MKVTKILIRGRGMSFESIEFPLKRVFRKFLYFKKVNLGNIFFGHHFTFLYVSIHNADKTLIMINTFIFSCMQVVMCLLVRYDVKMLIDLI